jgi:hypothetical protein
VEARRIALGVADLSGGPELIAEISLILGATRLDLGDARAHSDFGLAGRLYPGRAISTAEFKPSIVEAIAAAKRPSADRLLELGITAWRGSSIAINGVAVAQRSFSGRLRPGLHVVVATGPGRVPAADLVDLQRNSSMELIGEPDPWLSAIEEGRSSLGIGQTRSKIASSAAALMTYADLDALIIASATWRSGRAALIAERCEGVPVRCTRSAEVRYGGGGRLVAAAAEVWGSLDSALLELDPGVLIDTRIANAEPPPEALPPKGSRHWLRHPLVWAGLASAATIVVTIAVLGGDDDSRPEVHIGPELFP